MICEKCGKKIRNDSKFCYSCGTACKNEINNTETPYFEIRKMVCDNCQAVIEMDEEKDILYCPYCGSKELIIESDNVRIEKLRTNAQKQVALDKNQKSLERARIKKEKDLAESRHDLILILGLFGAMVLLCIVLTINDHLSDTGEPKISPLYSSSDLKGENVNSVISELEDEGFTNIKSVVVKPGLFDGDKIGQVKEIKIEDSSMSKNGKYDLDELVVIYYYDNELQIDN